MRDGLGWFAPPEQRMPRRGVAPRGHRKLAPHRGFFEELLGQDADMTLPELGRALEDATGVCAHSASIGRFLRKLGYR